VLEWAQKPTGWLIEGGKSDTISYNVSRFSEKVSDPSIGHGKSVCPIRFCY